MACLSEAHLRAVAAAAGCHVNAVTVDEDGVDAHVNRKGQHAACFTPEIHVQLKATSNWRVRPNLVVYDLKVATYERMIQVGCSIPPVLAVLLMPRNEDAWIDFGNDLMLLRHRLYWSYLVGRPPTTNTSTIAVALPTSQALDANGLVQLMHRVQQNGTVV